MGAWAAAFLALLLLTYAQAVSGVMQVEAGLGEAMGPLCGAPASSPPALAGMVMGDAASAPPTHASAKTNHAHASACPFCAAAAHAPVLGSVATLRLATTVAFAGFRVVASLGPRGPPAFTPHARGPPLRH